MQQCLQALPALLSTSMCNCFGGGKKEDREKAKSAEPTPENQAEVSIKRAARAAATSRKNTKAPPTQMTNSLSQPLLSSLSGVKTVELTELLQVIEPQPIANIVRAHGYELGDEIGKGSFAKVYQAKRRVDGLEVACKVMETVSDHRKESAKNELFIMERLNHPHIIKLYGHFIADMANIRYFFIFMQLAKGKSLSAYMRSEPVRQNPLPEATCQRIAAQIITALNCLHSKGIAHCDLKMGNVLLENLDDIHLRISDFGLSRIAYRASKGGTQLIKNKFFGTRSYAAPEQLVAREYADISYNPFIADIWALGVLLWCVINQKYPFNMDKPNVLEQQLAHKIKFSRKLKWEPSKTVHDFFYRILEPNVDERIKMPELMVHPWVIAEVRLVEEKIKAGSGSANASSSTSPGSTANSTSSSKTDGRRTNSKK